jgi:hypothetical protein
MRRMSAVMSVAVDTLVDIIGDLADKKEDANFCNLFQGLTLDVIGTFFLFLLLHVFATDSAARHLFCRM